MHGLSLSTGSSLSTPADLHEHRPTAASNEHLVHEPSSLRLYNHESSLVIQHDQREVNSDKENQGKTAKTKLDAEVQHPKQSACLQTLLSLLSQDLCTLDLGKIKKPIFTHGPSSHGTRTTLIINIEP